jgi:predicted secreted protein
MLRLVKADNGKSIEVLPGETVVVSLQEDAMGGYCWEIDNLDETKLAFIGTKLETLPGAAIGGGRVRSLSFKVTEPGSARIQLKLKRSWESDKSIADRYSVTVQILPEKCR